MGARGRGASARLGCVAEHSFAVSCLFRVVGETGDVAALGERDEDRFVQSSAAVRCERALDGEPCELVAEGDAVPVGADHARLETGVEPVELGRDDLLEQPELGSERDHGNRLEQPSRRRVEERHAREHGVANRLRQLPAARREDLGDKERVPERQSVDRIRIGPERRSEFSDRLQRETRHRQPHDARRGRELAEDDAQRMVARDLVVAVRGDDERVRAVDAPPEHAQDIERGAVRPVHVLEHERAAAREHRGRDRARLAGLEADVEERPERRGRGQVLAGAAQHLACSFLERADERRLADAGLAPDEDEVAAFAPKSLELRQELLPLEKLDHLLILARRLPPRNDAAKPS